MPRRGLRKGGWVPAPPADSEGILSLYLVHVAQQLVGVISNDSRPRRRGGGRLARSNTPFSTEPLNVERYVLPKAVSCPWVSSVDRCPRRMHGGRLRTAAERGIGTGLANLPRFVGVELVSAGVNQPRTNRLRRNRSSSLGVCSSSRARTTFRPAQTSPFCAVASHPVHEIGRGAVSMLRDQQLYFARRRRDHASGMSEDVVYVDGRPDARQ